MMTTKSSPNFASLGPPRATPKMDDTSHTCDFNRCPNQKSLNRGVRWWIFFQIAGVTSLSSCFFHWVTPLKITCFLPFFLLSLEESSSEMSSRGIHALFVQQWSRKVVRKEKLQLGSEHDEKGATLATKCTVRHCKSFENMIVIF